ncbi:MAG TPA: two-component regulator propeller domain-containing protein [Opitutaceae bacterium]|nr:two-component regulator propeller domain-containing protein [Opitutaceae bacterium]
MPGYPPCNFPGRLARAGWRIIFACLALSARLDAIPLPLEYHTRTWTVEDGLPHNSVSQTMQDSTGFLWFATLGGLARFDGREFREMRPPAEYRPRGFNIRGLAEERPGTLLVASTGPAVLRLAGTQWSVHPVTQSLTALNDSADEMLVDRDGNVWVTTYGRRLLRCGPDGKTETVVDAGPPGRGRRFTVASDDKGRVWIAADSTLGVFRDGAWQRDESTRHEQLMIAPGRSGRIWVCTARRLQRLEDGALKRELEQAPWGGELGYVRFLFEDSRRRIWILTSRGGFFCYEDGRLAAVPVPHPNPRHIAEDREGNLWVATDGHGVGQLGEKAHRIFSVANGLEHEVVSGVAEAPDGRIWLANRPGGLVSIAPDGTREVSASRGPGRSYANIVCVDAKNRIWFAGARNGVRRWTPGTLEIAELLPRPHPTVHLLYRARNDDIWFVGDPGVVGYYRDDKLHLLSGEKGFTAADVRAIAEDRAGDIWLGGRTGELLRWDGTRIERFNAPQGLPANPIHGIAVDAAGRLWIATAAGLVIKEGDAFRLLTQADGLADDLLEQVLEDDHGQLWFASRRGIFFVAKSELLAVARNGGRVTSHLVGRNQGLPSVQSIMNYAPAACKSRDGQLWFATAQGAIVIDPRKLPRDLPSPPVLIDEVRIDGRTVAPVKNLRVGPGAQRVEFRLAALTFTTPENVVVRHQLEGVDRDWTDTGAERTASYLNLAPRDYRLRVMARNSAGRWNTAGATLAFTVVPAWWETFYFRAGLAASLTALTAWLARTFAQRRLRLKLRQLEQDHALEKERARIARDLHDDLGASLTEVGLLADRLVGSAPRELGPQLSGLAWRTRRLATELSGIVWTMSESNSSLDRLAEFLRRYAERLFRNTGVSCVASGVEAIPAVPLAPDPQHQLLAASKEALNNILKHARATEARIELSYVRDIFEVRIVDNGTGFVLEGSAKPRGNGLRNIRLRLEEIGGSSEITSGPGCGTQVVLRFPCVAGAPPS